MELTHLTMSVVNSLYELAELPAAQRQELNDRADEIVVSILNEVFAKAENWDKLDAEIGVFYENEDDEDFEDDGNLCDIGEAAAIAFGYL